MPTPQGEGSGLLPGSRKGGGARRVAREDFAGGTRAVRGLQRQGPMIMALGPLDPARPARARDARCLPPLPDLVEGIVARGGFMARTIVVRVPVTPPRYVDAASGEIHEVLVGGWIRLRSPTALLGWSRRPAAAVPEGGAYLVEKERRRA